MRLFSTLRFICLPPIGSFFLCLQLAYAQPVISTITPLSGVAGSSTTIAGHGFNPTLANNVVYIGNMKATITAATALSLTVTVPTGATYGPVTVTNTATNLTAYSPQFFLPTASPSKKDLLPGDITPQSQINTGGGGLYTIPDALTPGDLDGDGKPDVVVSATNGPVSGGPGNVFSILRNNNTTAGADLSFATQVDVTIPGTYNRLSNASLADFDGDGKLDIAIVAHELDPDNSFAYVPGTTKLFVYLNTGTIAGFATATPAGPFALPDARTAYIAVADMNADGKPDVVTANGNGAFPNTYAVLINSRSGTDHVNFAAPQSFNIGGNILSLYLADMDADGKPDVVASHSSASVVYVSLNATTDGSPTYTQGTITPISTAGGAGIQQLAIGDLDMDGKPDIAVAQAGGTTDVQIFRNTTTVPGSFTHAAVYNLAADFGQRSIALGDINGDGKPDLLVGLTNTSTVMGAPKVSVFRNTGTSGTIGFDAIDKLSFPHASSHNATASSIVAADFNDDGKTDFLAAYSNLAYIIPHRNTLQYPPVISSFTPENDQPGKPVTITGTGFGTATATNIVYFGATKASITAASATSLTVTVPAGATHDYITVLNTTTGYQARSIKKFLPGFSPNRTGIDFNAADFAAAADHPVGAVPASVSVGDLNGDGRPDLAVANQDNDNVSVLLNNGSGGFAAAVDYAVGDAPVYVAIGDLNGDGFLDIAVANENDNNVSVLLNDGTGVFNAAVDYTVGSNPRSVAIGDLDSDGMPDLVVANFNDDHVSVLLNDGNGGFVAAVNYAVGSYPLFVAIGDLDGDGKPDLAVANGEDDNISILRNDGSGGFAAAGNYVVGDLPFSIAIGDLDDDGKPDLAVANQTDGTVSVLLNDGTGVFNAAVNYAVGATPRSVAIGDLDGDGKPDLAVANYSDGNVSVLRNNGSGFAAALNYAVGNNPNSVAIGDLDGNGRPDIATANVGVNTVSVLQNQLLTAPTVQASDILVSDFSSATATINWTNGSGGKRVVFLKSDNAGAASPVDGTDYTANAVFGDGDQLGSSGWYTVYNGTGNTAAVTGLSPSTTYRVMVVEYNDNDLADVARYQTAAATGNPVNFTTLPPPPLISSFSPLAAKPGESITLTGQHFDPLPANNIVYFGATKASVTSASATSLTVTVPVGATYAPIAVLNTGSHLSAVSPQSFHPIFAPHKGFMIPSDISTKVDLATGDQPVTVAYGDLDGDGKPDMAVANSTDQSIAVFLNTGSIGNVSFTRQDISLGGSATVFGLVIGDIDGDGKPDLAATVTNGNYVSVHRNISTGPGNIDFEAESQFPVQSSPINLALGDIDGDGRPDLAVANGGSNSFSILRNTGSPGTVSFAAHASYATGSTHPDGIMISDINQDGRPDVIIANKGSNSISIFPNNSNPGTLAFDVQHDAIAGAVPTNIAIGDMDGDGMPDIAVTNQTGDHISVFRNTGVAGESISLDDALTFAAGDQPMGISIGDINGDGKADLVVANYRSDDVSVLRNTSSGTAIDFVNDFNLPTAGLETRDVVLADVDGDGKPDITVLTQASDRISVFLNNVQVPPIITSFTPSAAAPGNSITLTGEHFNTTAADNIVFFGPVKAMVTAGTAASLTVTVPAGAAYSPISVLNTANGLGAYSESFFLPAFEPNKDDIITADFKPKVDLPSGAKPEAVAIVDFDGDGKPDMASVNYDGNTVSVFYNTGSAGSVSFAGGVDYATGTNPTSVAIGDIDGDGKPDMAITNYNSDMVTIYRNTSTPENISFAGRLDLSVGGCPFFVIIRDLDGDGKADLATANKLSNSVSVLKNISTIGTILFEAKQDYTVGAAPYSLVVGDIDGDHKPDLIAANYGDGTLSLLRNISDAGAIGFAPATDVAVPGAYSVSVGDLDGDGKLDLVTANLMNQQALVLRNTSSTGNFSFDPAVTLVTGDRPYSVAIGDLNGDGKPDLAIPNYNSNTISVFSNTGSTGIISFATHTELVTGEGPAYAAIGDLDGDEKPDLATANYTGNTISVLQNRLLVSPATQASDIIVSALSATTATINWTNGDGSKRIVFVKEGNTSSVLPVDGTDYIANTVFGSGDQIGSSGWYAVYNGTGSTVDITGLAASTVYRVMVVEYNDHGLAGAAKYLTATASNNPLNVTAESSNAELSALTFSVGSVVPAFSPETTDYTITVNSAGSMTVTPTAADVSAGITVNTIPVISGNPSGSINLSPGSNTITVEVTAEDNAFTKTYTITVIRQIPQVITFAANAAATYGDADFDPGASSDHAGIAVTYSSSDESVATIVSGKIHILKPGTTAITASQVGDGTYLPASKVQVLTVIPKPLTLSLNASPAINKIYDGTNSASLDVGNYSLSGVEAGDVVSVSGAARYSDANAGSVKIITAGSFVLSGTDKDNYSLSTVSATTTGDIRPKPLTLSLNASPAISKIYDGTNSASLDVGNYSLSGVEAGDVVSVSGAARYSDANAGSVKIITAGSFVLSGTDKDNYSLSTASATVTGEIIPATLQITANPFSTIYTGIPYDGGNGVSYSGFVNGEDQHVLSGALSYTGSSQGAIQIGIYEIIPQGYTSSNYTITYYKGTLTVSLNTANVLSFNAQTAGRTIVRTYGDADLNASAVASSGLAVGYVSSNESVAEVDSNGQVSIRGVGTAVITASQGGNANYAKAEPIAFSIRVEQKPLVVRANSVIKTYDGQPYTGGNGVSYEGFIPGEDGSVLGGTLSYGGTSQGAVEAGSYDVEPRGLSSANYRIDYSAGTLVIVPADGNSLTFNSQLAGGTVSVTYGGKPLSAAATSTKGLPVSYVCSNESVATVDGNGQVVIRGAGNAVITAQQPGDENHSPATSISLTLRVASKPLVVTANNAGKVYDGVPYKGGNDVQYTGFVYGEDASALAGTLTYGGTAQGATGVGSYFIEPGGLSSANYAIEYRSGSLSVTKRPVTVGFSPDAAVSKEYDGVTTGTVTADQLGITAGEVVNGDDLSVSLSAGTVSYRTTDAGEGKPVTLSLTDVTLVGNDAGNYSIGNTADITAPIGIITKRPLTVTANSWTKVYDGASFRGGNGVAFDGFVAGEDASILSGTAVYRGSAQGAVDAGTYDIVPSGLQAANYSLEYRSGRLNITPATRNVVFPVLPGKTYEDADFDGGASSTSGESISYSISNPSVAEVTSAGLIRINGAGETTITATVPENDNYLNRPETTRLLTVSRASQSIGLSVPAQVTRDAGSVAIAATSGSGLVVGLSIDDPQVATLDGTMLHIQRLGTVQITAVQEGDSNYEPAEPVTVTVRVIDPASDFPVRIHRAVSPNGDGVNEYLIIEAIKDYPDNRVRIFNRNGTVVYEASGYNNGAVAFRGIGTGQHPVPAGTYFYVAEIRVNGEWKYEKGWFVLRY